MKKRNIGIDCLKFISMLGVVTLHLLGIAEVQNNIDVTQTYIIGNILLIISSSSVNIFAIVTGYIYFEKKQHYRNLLSLLATALFYNIILTIIAKLFYPSLLTTNTELISFIYPPIRDRHWYLTSYFILFLFIPVLNSFVLNNDLSIIKKSIIIMGIVLSFSGISMVKDIFYIRNGYSSLWLMFCYLIGAYIKKRGRTDYNNKMLVLHLLLSCFIIFISRIIIKKVLGYQSFINIFMQYISPFVLINSIIFVLLFKDIRMNNSLNIKIVEFFSMSSFDVYILHTHPLLLDNFIYPKFDFIYIGNFFFVVLKIIIHIISIYVCCSFFLFFTKRDIQYF